MNPKLIATLVTAFLAGETAGVVRANRRARKIIIRKNEVIRLEEMQSAALRSLILDSVVGVPAEKSVASFVEKMQFINVAKDAF